MKKTIIILIIALLTLGTLTGCDSKKDTEKDLEETIKKYGYVEKETVDVLVAKFNTEVMNKNNDNKLNPASDDYLTINDNKYWYGLIEGIYLVAVPQEFTNDKSKDIVDYTYLYVEKEGKYMSDAETYIRHLIKANNSDIKDDEVDELINSAKEKSVEKETANNGKGISVGYTDTTDNYQYQVKRLYKD